MHADATLAAEEPFVLTTVASGVATLTLNRPQRFNPLSSQMIAALHAELRVIAGNPAVRVVILAAEGKGFCAGHDLKEMRAHSDDKNWQRGLFDDLETAGRGRGGNGHGNGSGPGNGHAGGLANLPDLPELADAELLAHPALAAVSRHQKLGANRACVPAGSFTNRGGDALPILLERHQFGPEAQIPAELFGSRSQHRLQHILSNSAARHRAAKEGANIFLQAVKLLTNQALHQRQVAVLGDRWFNLANGRLDPNETEYLHRARSKARGTRMNRSTGMALDQQRGNALPGEEEGG